MAVEKLKKQILSEIENAFLKAFDKKPGNLKLEFPPDVKLGDFAVEFFGEARNLKMNPAEVAKKVEEGFLEPHPNPLLGKERGVIARVKSTGPYLNIKINNSALFGAVVSEDFSDFKTDKKEKVMVEYLSPNTNKPLHLGHARNGSIGMAIAKILEANGHDTIKALLINDRGVHISKSMLAWLKWGNGETPKSTKMKGDHFVGKYYVKYAQEEKNNPELKREIQEMLKKWEGGDREILKTWKMMNEWFYEGLDKTCEDYDFQFDERFYESDTYKLGKDIIAKGLREGVFRKDETGAAVFDLPEAEFGKDKDGKLKKQTVLRADGTSVYMTQDLGTAVKRFEKYNLDKLIYVVGSEQIFHFKVLFKILELLGYSWAKNLFHYSYGMIALPEGKMKSREGTVVDADDLLLEVEKIVADGIKERNPDITPDDLENRARVIALGAIKFHLLRVRPNQDIMFDPKESVAIDGFTGPYCQYVYARISGIFRKLPHPNSLLSKEEVVDFSVLGNEDELKLIQKLIQFPDEVKKSAEELNPLKIINSVYEICQTFNLFYNNNQVLDNDDEKLSAARLKLSQTAAAAIKKGLELLGIGVLERM